MMGFVQVFWVVVKNFLWRCLFGSPTKSAFAPFIAYGSAIISSSVISMKTEMIPVCPKHTSENGRSIFIGNILNTFFFMTGLRHEISPVFKKNSPDFFAGNKHDFFLPDTTGICVHLLQIKISEKNLKI